jgi:hypothetical protein
MKKRLFTRFIGILVPEEVYREVKQISDENDITVTTYLRTLIGRDLDSRKRKGEKEMSNAHLLDLPPMQSSELLSP